MLKKLLVICRIYYLSFKSIFKLNSGDFVILKGDKWVLLQSVDCGYWNLIHHDSKGRVDGFDEKIHELRFRKVYTYSSIMRSLKFSYRYYMDYYFILWCGLPIYKIFFVTENNI